MSSIFFFNSQDLTSLDIVVEEFYDKDASELVENLYEKLDEKKEFSLLGIKKITIHMNFPR